MMDGMKYHFTGNEVEEKDVFQVGNLAKEVVSLGQMNQSKSEHSRLEVCFTRHFFTPQCRRAPECCLRRKVSTAAPGKLKLDHQWRWECGREQQRHHAEPHWRLKTKSSPAAEVQEGDRPTDRPTNRPASSAEAQT